MSMVKSNASLECACNLPTSPVQKARVGKYVTLLGLHKLHVSKNRSRWIDCGHIPYEKRCLVKNEDEYT